MLLISQNKKYAIESHRIESVRIREDDGAAEIVVNTDNNVKYLFGRYPDVESAKEQITDLGFAWGLQKAFAFK